MCRSHIIFALCMDLLLNEYDAAVSAVMLCIKIQICGCFYFLFIGEPE